MKKINKLFLSLILTALCLCSSIPFIACDNRNWIEVQEVSYNGVQGGGVLSSVIEWTATCEKITIDEYNSAPENIKLDTKTRVGDTPEILKSMKTYDAIELNRTTSLAKTEEKIGNFYYCCESWYSTFNNYPYDYPYMNYYYKCTYTNYKTEYVKINFLNDDSIEIYFMGNTIKTFPDAYNITYFND